jgi:hypothetical protein
MRGSCRSPNAVGRPRGTKTKQAAINSLRRGATYKASVNIGAENRAGNPLAQNSSTSGLQLHRWYLYFQVKLECRSSHQP